MSLATNPRTANPGSTASVDAAYISAISRIVAEGMRMRSEGIVDPATIDAQVAAALAQIPQAPAGVQVPGGIGLPAAGATNAPTIRRYNPATGKIE
jgi:hypothetical protein